MARVAGRGATVAGQSGGEGSGYLMKSCEKSTIVSGGKLSGGEAAG